MSSSATEHTEVIVKVVLTFLQSELSVFPEFVAKAGGISGGSRLARVTVLMALVLFVVVGIAGIVTRVQVTSFLIGLVFVRLVLIGFTLLGVGFLAKTLVVMGVDGVRENLHGFESGQLALLAHNVFDLFSEAGIITVTEDGVVPASLDSKTVELDIVLHDVLIVRLLIPSSVLAMGSMGPNWVWRVQMKADQLSIQSGVPSESSMVSLKYSRAVPQRKDNAKVTFGLSS